MSAKAVELADAIVEVINGATAGTYSQPFTAIRRNLPFATIEELKDLQVVVFCGPKASERVGRGVFQKTHKPVVAVLQKIAAGDEPSRLAKTDALQELVEEIEGVLEDEDLAGLTFVGFDEEQERDPYNLETLKNLGAFIIAITVEYSG